MNDLLLAKSIFVGCVFLSLFVAERIIRAAPAAPSAKRLFRNGGLWLVAAIASPLIVAPITALGANNAIWNRDVFLISGATATAVLIIDLIILDLWTYWLHRAYHRVPVMWRLHEVHHRDEFLDTTSAVRFHILEIILSASLRLIPIALLATPLTTVIIFEALLLSAAFFHHSNIKMPAPLERALSWVIVTPSIHWVHHHARRSDTDSNYASILSVWDRVFSSRSRTKRTENMKIGAEGVEELSFLGLMLSPFMRRRR